MAVVPDPRKLLLPDPDNKPSFLSDKFVTIFATTIGLAAVTLGRYAKRRPLLSGIHEHVIISATLGCVAFFGERLFFSHIAERDAIYRHYIELHPEDFPMPERKKVGELFEKWYPVR